MNYAITTFLKRHRLAQAATAAGALLSVCLAPPPAHAADICRPPTVRHFKINTASFVNAYSSQLSGITEDAIEWWVLYAAKQWAAQSGAGIALAYDGRTTALPHCQAPDYTSDGNAVIAAYPMAAVGWTNGEDLCTNASMHYFVTAYPTYAGQGGSFDLVGTLMHEFGHWLGLKNPGSCLPGQIPNCDSQGHVDHTVMASGQLIGTPITRTLAGNDILRLRNRYASETNSNCSRAGGGWRTAIGMNVLSGFGGPRPTLALNYQVFGPPGATLAPLGGTQESLLVSRAIYDSDGPRTPHGSSFTRVGVAADQSLTDQTENSYSTLKTHFAPALAAKQGLALAAWPGYQDYYYQCQGIWIAKSSNLFSTLTWLNLSGDCTLRQPALAFDPVSQRFILAYVFQSSQVQYYSTDPGDPLQDTLIVRTSSDGVTWTAPQYMGVFVFPLKSADSPGLACNTNGVCVLTGTTTYLADGRPVPVAAQLTINASNGQVTMTSAVAADPSHLNAYHVGTAVSSNNWFWQTQWTDPADRLNGGITYDEVTPAPPAAPTDFNYGILTTSVIGLFPPRIAGNPTSSWTYTIPVQ